MIRQLLFLLLLPLALVGQEISLLENLAKAEPGHYLVTEQNKTYTFLHISENSNNRIIMEEVSIPGAKYPQRSMMWRDWFESGAPGHTSWIQSQINLTTGECEEAYSIPHQSWIDTTETSRFMATLLNLRFTETPSVKRRKVGPAPGYGKPDRRLLWHPRLIVDGDHHQNIPFQAWTARWPADGSELSHKKVEIYLPDTTTQTYPTHFPYWLEVEGKLGRAKIRVIDSGTGVHSPRSAMPSRTFQMFGKAEIDQEGLRLQFTNSSYFNDFILLAEEVDSPLGKTSPLPCQIHTEGATLILTVPHDELEKSLVSNEKYRFLLLPKGEPTICVETQPILYL